MASRPEAMDEGPPPRRYRWWRFVERHLPIIVIYLMVSTLVGFLIAPNVLVTVPTGHVGVLWKRFRGGTQLDPRLLKEEGLRVLLPWDSLFLYDLRLQTSTDTYNAISKDGVNLAATINIRFRLKHDAIPQLHQAIGPDYLSKLVRPEIGNRAREIIAEYTAEEVYSTKRQEIQKRIRTHTEAMLGQSMIQRTKEESEYGEHYRISLGRDTQPLRHAGAGLGVAKERGRSDQSQGRAVLSGPGVRLPRRSGTKGIGAQANRGRRHSCVSADRQPRHFGFLRTLARHRGHSAVGAVAKHQDRHHRQRQGRPAGHLGNVDSPIAPKSAGTPVPDNSEAAQERPAGASPPLLEKLPASNLPSPPERAPPTAVPRAPGEPQPPAPSSGPSGKAPSGAPGNPPAAPPGKQSSSWTPSLSGIQALVSKVVGSSEPTKPGMAPSPPPPSLSPQPHRPVAGHP